MSNEVLGQSLQERGEGKRNGKEQVKEPEKNLGIFWKMDGMWVLSPVS